MRKQSPRRRWLFWLCVALVLTGVIATLRTRAAWEEACTLARRQLPSLLDAEVGIGRCEIDPLTQSVRLYGVSAYRQGSTRPLLAVDAVELKLAAVQPFFGTVELALLKLERPRFHLDLGTPAPGSAEEKRRSEAKADSGKCPLDLFRRVELDRLAISDGQLSLTLPDGRALELTGLDAGWRIRRGVAELTVDLQEGFLIPTAGGRPMAISRAAVEGELDVDGETFSLGKAELDVEDVTVSVTGKIEELCSPRLLLDVQAFLPLKTLARATGMTRPMAGHTWTRLQLSGEAREPTVAIDVVATGIEVGRYRPGDFNASATIAGQELRIGEVSFDAGPGTLKASGRVGLRHPYPISVQASADDAQLGRVLERVGIPGAWVDFLGSGSGQVQGQLRPSLELTGEATVRVSDFKIATRAFDAPASLGKRMIAFEQGELKTPVRILADRVELPGLQLSTGKSRLEGTATLYNKPEDGLVVKGRAPVLDLSDFGQVAQLDWAGRGSAEFEVRGPYRRVVIEAATSFTDFRFWDFDLGVVQGKVSYQDQTLSIPAITGQKGQTQYAGRVQLGFGKKETEVDARLELGRKGGRLQDVVDMIVGLHPSLDLFQGPLEGKVTGEILVRGPTSRFQGPIDLNLSHVTYYGRRLGDGEVKLAFVDGEAMELGSLQLQGPLGTLKGSGRWVFGGALDYTFQGTGLSLAELSNPGGATVGATDVLGEASLKVQVSGDTELPRVSGKVVSPRVQVAGRDLGDMDLSLQIVGRELELVGRPFLRALAPRSGDQGSVQMTLRAPVPYRAEAAIGVPDLRTLLGKEAVAQGLTGSLAGQLKASGHLSGKATADVEATFDRLTLARGDFRAENDGPLRLTYVGDTLTVDPFTVRGPTTQLTGAGTLGDGKLDARLQGTLDVRLLETFVTSVERTTGTVELTMSATGRPDRPVLVGGARIKDAGMTLRDRPVTLRSLSGQLEFSEQRVLLEEVHGVLNDGRLSLQGNVQVDRSGIKWMDLTAQLENVFYPASEDLPLTVSGIVEVTGSLARYRTGAGDPLSVGGSVDLTNVLYERPLVLDTFIRDLGRQRIYYGQGEKPREWLYFRDLGVNLSGVRIDNNLAKAQLVGQLKVTGSNAKTGLIGVVESTEGSQAFFRGNSFDLRQGTIEFRDREAIESVFDLHAETQVREYQVKLHAFGRTKDPKVILTSDPALPEGDIISLLTLGVTSRDRNENASAAATYIAADAFLTASGLDRQVQRFLPKNSILLNPQVHIATGYNESSGQVEPLASLESRLLLQQLKLGMTRPFSGRGTRVNLEWQLENGLSAQAQWDENSEAQSPFGNVGLDLKLRWEVE